MLNGILAVLWTAKAVRAGAVRVWSIRSSSWRLSKQAVCIPKIPASACLVPQEAADVPEMAVAHADRM